MNLGGVAARVLEWPSRIAARSTNAGHGRSGPGRMTGRGFDAMNWISVVFCVGFGGRGSQARQRGYNWLG